MKDLESDTALNFAHAIADLIQAADESAIRDGTIQKAGWCMVQLLDVVQDDKDQRFNAKRKEWEAKDATEAAAKEHRDRVATYLSTRTSPETRAELAPLINETDIANELNRIAGIDQHLRECLAGLDESKQLAKQLLTQHDPKALAVENQSAGI